MTATTARRRTPAAPVLTPEEARLAEVLEEMSQITFETMEVTPAMAHNWLRRNMDTNRSVRSTKVNNYAEDIRTGRWRMTGDTIKFNPDGDLVDGQHRLHGVIEADKSAIFTIARGVPQEAVAVIDTGAARTFADVLRMEGATYRFASAAVVRRVLLWDAGNFTGRRGGRSGSVGSPTHSALLERYMQEPKVFDSSAARGDDLRRIGIGTAATNGTAFYLFRRINVEDCHQFFDALSSGANLGETHPVLVLRNRIMQGKPKPGEQLALYIRAWNHFRKGNTVDRLQLTREGLLTNENHPRPL